MCGICSEQAESQGLCQSCLMKFSQPGMHVDDRLDVLRESLTNWGGMEVGTGKDAGVAAPLA